MKNFTDLELEIQDGPKKLKRSDLIIICLGKAPVQGLTVAGMKTTLSTLSKFENINQGFVELADEELELIKASIDAFPWAIIHKDIVALSDYLHSIK